MTKRTDKRLESRPSAPTGKDSVKAEKRSRRKYTDEDKANALTLLTANNGDQIRVADMLGMPRATLARWALGQRVNASVQAAGTAKKSDLAIRFDAAIDKYLELANGKADTATFRDLWIAAGIAYDKAALLRGESTSNVALKVSANDVRNLTDEQLARLNAGDLSVLGIQQPRPLPPGKRE